MPRNAEVRIKGYDELAAGTKTLARHIAEEAPDKFRGVADDVAGMVSGRVPVLTGTLSASVVSDVTGEAATVGYGDIPYARFVEFGGRGHAPSAEGHYLYPTAIEAVSILEDAATRLADDEIGAMHWPSPT